MYQRPTPSFIYPAVMLYVPRIASILQFVTLCLLGGWATAQPPYELIIQGGRIVDGTGAPWYTADVAIAGGKIVAIGRIDSKNATETIDARGLIVAPGFIDMMGQTATPLMNEPASARNLLTQGITTINCGEGSSAAPLNPNAGASAGWTTMHEYLALLDMQGLPVNVVQTVGHTQIRELVLGDTDRRPSADELKRMQDLVREAMEAGAIGVSTALIYPPAVYSTTEEIAQLTKTAGEFGGRYYTHMRNEGDKLLEAIEEALEVGRQAETPVHIFHLKTAGQQNWAKMPQAIARIKSARQQGQQVAADIYPYINNGLGIAALIHPRHSASGLAKLIERLDDVKLRAEIRREMEKTDGWENWYRHVGYDWDRVVLGRTQAARYREHTGESIAEMAKKLSEDPWDTFFNLAKSGAFVLPQSMSEENKVLAIQQEFISYCTDVGPASEDEIAGHPRAYGAFPRLLSRYVREQGAISLERAVAGASAAAANEIMAFDRGRIAIGLAADIVIFNYEQLTDKATFAKPDAESVGVQHVLVAGVPVLRSGVMTDARPGRVLRGPGYRPDIQPARVSTGSSNVECEQFDRLVSEFVDKHSLPGIAVAVSKKQSDGSSQIILQKGYGYADLATQEPVTASHLFRIASISKPITAVAVLKMVEQGQFKLDDSIFELLKLNDQAKRAGEAFDTRWQDITVGQLLQHRGGWDRDQSFDAMFQSVRFAKNMNVPAPADPQAIIGAMLRQKLDFNPGARYAYSNFGYCLLGRLIETSSGQSYEDYVRQEILAPMGINEVKLGKTLLAERQPHEVRYYQPGQGRSVFEANLNAAVPPAYGAWNLEAMDSHGGWIASAEDLVRFAMAFDNPDHCPVLKRSTIEIMFARPEEPPRPDKTPGEAGFYYSLGWMNRAHDDGSVNHWHTGSLDGTATILIRRTDGYNIVALINTRSSPTSDHLGRDVDRLLHRAVDTLK